MAFAIFELRYFDVSDVSGGSSKPFRRIIFAETNHQKWPRKYNSQALASEHKKSSPCSIITLIVCWKPL